MSLPPDVERQLNAAISKIHQTRDAMRRAKDYGDLIAGLQSSINSLADPRRRAITEVALLPGASLQSVADELGLSKSAVAKLVTPDLRQVIGEDLRKRLARGFNPPPQRR